MRRVLFYPYSRADVVPERAPFDLVRQWQELHPLEYGVYVESEELDLEHWTESVYLLKALVDVLGAERVEIAAEHSSTEGRVVFGAMPKYRAYSEQQLWPVPTSERAALRYHLNPAFHRLARRRVATADLADEDGYTAPGRSLRETLSRFRSAHIDRVLLKFMAAPKALPLLELDLNEPSIGEIDDWLGYEIIRCEGVKDAVLVQAFADVRLEYRFFVVGGQLVTGSGQIDELTPHNRLYPCTVRGHRLSAWAGTFYPVAAQTRSSDDLSTVNFGPDAHSFVQQLMDADPRLQDFVIDVAMIDGQPGVVELNPIGTSGLFASSPRDLVRAVMAKVEGNGSD